ncbi:hypothetical protein CS022_13035 [Veronia nyctiphanis]|uniref:Uncharacterized protein n=1 Tax=Veronia nyctiphanis TaxID=1278244 RepID=A0A4Q0YQE4_9GAMM|nr:hypothetical protein [Veronia nyctiphanis]RXJ72785.1 hypothetical protein CS022_13035 [Veronia nyctiphanis]
MGVVATKNTETVTKPKSPRDNDDKDQDISPSSKRPNREKLVKPSDSSKDQIDQKRAAAEQNIRSKLEVNSQSSQTSNEAAVSSEKNKGEIENKHPVEVKSSEPIKEKNTPYNKDDLSRDVNKVTSLIKDTNAQIESQRDKFSKDVNIDTNKIISPEVVANTKFKLADIDNSKYKDKYQGATALYDDKTNTVTLDKQRFGNLSPDERTSVLVHELRMRKKIQTVKAFQTPRKTQKRQREK